MLQHAIWFTYLGFRRQTRNYQWNSAVYCVLPSIHKPIITQYITPNSLMELQSALSLKIFRHPMVLHKPAEGNEVSAHITFAFEVTGEPDSIFHMRDAPSCCGEKS